jgi:probable F420-dependent oxidoreductase
MKVGIGGINSGPMAGPETVLQLARDAEQLGYESLWPFEHICVPRKHQPYPGTPDGQVPGGDRGQINEPILQLTFVAAATSRIKLGTGALVLPLHNPLHLAKQLATLDVLSHGRVIMGVVNGWLSEEYEALGIEWKTRGKRTDESIAVLRTLWREETASFHGRHFNFDEVYSFPKPMQPNGIPVLIGGHTVAAARRAGRLGDGFYPIVSDVVRLKELITAMKVEARGHGRNPDEIEITLGVPSPTLDKIKELRDLGVSRVIARAPAAESGKLRRELERIAEKVVAKV